MDWKIWAKKLAVNTGLAVVAIAIAEAIALSQKPPGSDNLPFWAPAVAGLALVVLKAIENLLKHAVLANGR